MKSIDVDIAVTAGEQHGVVARHQLVKQGVGRSSIARRRASGLLKPVGPGTYALPWSADSWEARVMAAVVGAGAEAYASHRTAAALLGFDGFARDGVQITIPFGRRLVRNDLKVHRTRRPPARIDLAEVDGIRCSGPLRTIFDLSAVAPRHQVAGAIDSAIRDRRTTSDRLGARLGEEGNPGVRGRRMLAELVFGLPAGGLHSPLERTMFDLAGRHGLPVPQTQVVLDVDGKVVRLDCVFPDQFLIVEVSGHRTHSSRADRQADAQRHRGIELTGWRWIEFTSDEIFRSPDACMAELARHLARG